MNVSILLYHNISRITGWSNTVEFRLSAEIENMKTPTIKDTHTKNLLVLIFGQSDCRLTSRKPSSRPCNKWVYLSCVWFSSYCVCLVQLDVRLKLDLISEHDLKLSFKAYFSRKITRLFQQELLCRVACFQSGFWEGAQFQSKVVMYEWTTHHTQAYRSLH